MLFKELINRAHQLESNPNCFIYYSALGTYQKDQNTEAQKTNILQAIKNQKVFHKIEFNYVDDNIIQNDYKKIGQKISRTFNFPKKILISTDEMKNVEDAFIGVIPVSTIVDLIQEDGELITSIFYDNVRDFQGGNKINEEIKKSIYDDNLKFAFSLLNNGITIVAEKLTIIRDSVTITNYQIINGLQTSRVLHASKEYLDGAMFVPLKLIITRDENLISKIIRSTNRQTEVKEEDLMAYSGFQKKLEDFFQTFNESEKLFYERRSKQYNSSNIDTKLIIDKSTLIKVMGSFYLMKPNIATRYFGTLITEFGEKLFIENHKLLSYYTAALVYHKLDNSFKNGLIDKKYKKIKYFILMMLRLEYKKEDVPKFESKKSEIFCKDFLEFIKNENNFRLLLQNVTNKLDTILTDDEYNSTEISKSSVLVDKCKEQYFNKNEHAYII